MPLLQYGSTRGGRLVGDYDDERLSLNLNVALVDDVDQTIDYFCTHGTSHSGAILPRSLSSTEHFVRAIDSSACTLTPAPASPKAASSAWAQKWPTAPRNCTPAAQWGSDHLQVARLRW
ncbi:Gamma-glutamyl phosphate reductase [Serratia proteamaculans]|nr:Gamma-glutamyl phosphate reductase [Serratia proteamaculans]